MDDRLDFKNQVAIITGAAGGLGREYALLLADRGASLVVNDPGGSVHGDGSDGGPAERLAQEIRDLGGAAVADSNSVASQEGGEAIVKTALDEFGSIEIVINNAGVLRDKAFHNLTSDLVDIILDVHLKGAFYVTRPAWLYMREHAYGRIVNTTSNSGLIGNFGQSNYGAAKMGLVGLTRVLAAEGKRFGIFVNAIAPAAVTRMTEKVLKGDAADAFVPSKVAPAVAWLCHPNCETTGEIFSAGAGRVARFFIGLTYGYFDRDITIEGVAEHFDQIRSTEIFTIPENPNEELEDIMARWSASRA
jgi:NAD(P)-dependent dehydrogenase (short-subunit alcohol dehydrogenase family)